MLAVLCGPRGQIQNHYELHYCQPFPNLPVVYSDTAKKSVPKMSLKRTAKLLTIFPLLDKILFLLKSISLSFYLCPTK